MRWQKPVLHSPWPSHRHACLLRAALGDRNALAEWERDADLAKLDHASLSLIPLLYRTTGAERYKGVYQWSWYRNALLFRALRTAVEALDAAAIPSFVLKGAALTATVYADRGVRYMGDADVLVPAAFSADALRTLAAAGFAPREELGAGALRERHSVPLFDAEGRSIDLHWHAFADEIGSEEELFARAVPIDLAGVRTRTLCAEHQLLLVICHGFIASANTVGVQWVSDAVTLLRATPALDWKVLIDAAAKREVLLTLRRALWHLREEYGAPVPLGVLVAAEARPVRRAERIEYWFKLRDASRTPVGALPSHWFRYSRVCRRASRSRSLGGFMRHLRDRQSLGTRSFAMRAALWPVRQLLWFASSIKRRAKWPVSASTHPPS